MKRSLDADRKLRYYRHGETFWRDLIERQKASGQGVRKFCLANGVPPSTFHKWRAMLGKNGGFAAATVSTPVATADAVFIPILQEVDAPTNLLPEPARASMPKGAPHDSVIVTSGGMRVEMTGAHADRIVRHLLNRMNGFAC